MAGPGHAASRRLTGRNLNGPFRGGSERRPKMGTMARTSFRGIAALSLGLAWGLAQAQQDLPETDPPGRAARLSYIQGEVSLQPAGEEEWAPALLNRPLTSGDKLWTERGARAEISVGPAAVRLDADTGFSFLNVDDDAIQMRMTAGVLNVSVRHLDDREHIEIDTPNVAVVILREGSYRLEVNDAGDRTVVKVSEGAADVTGSGDSAVVHAGQAVSFFGVDEVVTRLDRLGSPDEFDDWTLERDRREERLANSRTSEYVSPDVTGYEDLEEHGSWSSEAEYGYVWTPRYVSVDWSPYRYGRWVWISPWGWSWIDDAPWGYAPFHYGRWVHVRHRWCWVPGPRHHRAVYAPALVGWVGSSGHRVSWFPLGPREVYVPWGRHTRRYIDRVNDSNTVVERRQIADAIENRLRDRFRNREAGLTTVSRDSFTSARRTGQNRIRDNEPSTERSIASTIAPRIDPSRESRLGGQARNNVRRPPATVSNRQVVVRREPPAALARYARRPQETRPDNREVVQQPAQRDVRQQLRDRVAAGERSTGDSASLNRNDRPPRADRPQGESAAPVRSPVTDPRAIADRVREDRDRQVREHRQREDENLARQRRQEDQSRREQRERPERPQDATRSAVERRFEQREQQQRERSVERERPRVEQPRIERPREQPRVERPREQPRAEQPRVERPREQPRAEPPRNEQPRVPRNNDGGRRHRD